MCINSRLTCAEHLARGGLNDLGLIVAELQGPVPGIYGNALHLRILLAGSFHIFIDCNGAIFCHQTCNQADMNIRSRQDAIVHSLCRKGTASVDTLAGEVGVSRRTVLRDIGALRDQGFVIHSEPARGGGLQLDPHSIQATARLAVAEVFALLISVAAMRVAGNLPFSDLADAGLAKIEKMLPADKVRDLRHLLAACRT